MKKVFKYPVPSTNKKFSIILPLGFKFLRMSWQQDQLMAWYEVSEAAKKVPIYFETFGTGQEIPMGHTYVTTFDNGPFVFHVYQEGIV